jgi:hypothetical protein
MDSKTEVTEVCGPNASRLPSRLHLFQCLDAGSVPNVTYNFATLEDLADRPKDAVVGQ